MDLLHDVLGLARRALSPFRRMIGHAVATSMQSADLATWLNFQRDFSGERVLKFWLAGRTLNVHARGRTLDATLATMILRRDSEYRLPFDLKPRVIFDIGANTGLAALYFATIYPNARIYCFEPLPDNLRLLRLNAANFQDRIIIIPKGLGDREGAFDFHPSLDGRNFGGGTFHRLAADLSKPLSLPVTTFKAACAKLGVDQVDLVKIDTEGAEWPILRAIPKPDLARISAIIGELHSVGDLAVIRRLSADFHLGIQKRLEAGCYPFIARNRALKTAEPVAWRTEMIPGARPIPHAA